VTHFKADSLTAKGHLGH